MIAILVIMYFILNNIYQWDKEFLMKAMLIICVVNLIPLIVYSSYAYSTGGVDANVLIMMALI
jgi:hypothetical protein